MRWSTGRRSDNIEDRRGQRVSRGVVVGGLGGLGTLVVIVLALVFGVDPTMLLQQSGDPGPSTYEEDSGSVAPVDASPQEEQLKDFVSVVVADTEDTWASIFGRSGERYAPPTLVLFRDAVRSACGFAESAVGPFYCPADGKVYLDLAFLDELRARFRAPGDFAQAYVIAHEVGHHVQNLLGLAQQVQEAQSRMSREDANSVSVRFELQADCLAGVWASSAARRDILDAGDVEEALGAAAAIGDDRIQRETRGYVVPDSFTHGSSAQRVQWFRTGLSSGSVDACDTFRSGR
jgi:predicted metalloprotease